MRVCSGSGWDTQSVRAQWGHGSCLADNAAVRPLGLGLMRAPVQSFARSLNYTALPYLEIGDHTAIFFLHPVITTLFSYPVLGEEVRIRPACRRLFVPHVPLGVA